MDLFEHEAKELFAEYGVPVQAGAVAHTAAEARAIAAGFAASGHPLVVVKAQVKTGGRGKAGGVKLADGPDEADAKASQILGMDIKGHTVQKVLIAQASDIAQEYYLSYLVDRAGRQFMSICSVEGGVEIEEVAHANPEAVARIGIDPLVGVDRAKAAEIVQAGRLPAEAAEGAVELAERLWAVFTDEDATLVEVNPLVLTDDGEVLAARRQGDAGRQRGVPAAARQVRRPVGDRPDRGAGPRPSTSTTSSSTARSASSATEPGLVMSTLDVVAYAGEEFGGVRPANFLDIGGGASAEVMANGLDIVLSDPSVRAVLVNVFGGITSCDAVANGIVSAIGILAERGEAVSHPIVVRLDGNNAAEGRRILTEAGNAVVEQVDDDGRRGAARRRAGQPGRDRSMRWRSS